MEKTIKDFKEMDFEDKTIMDLMEKHLKEKKSNGFRGNGF